MIPSWRTMQPVPTPLPCCTLPNGPGWKTSVVTFTTAGSVWRTTAATGSALPFGAPPPGAAPAELADRPVRSTEQAEATNASPTMPIRILRKADPPTCSRGYVSIRCVGPGGSPPEPARPRCASMLRQRPGWTLLAGIDERDRRGDALDVVAILGFDIQPIPRFGEPDRDPHVADVLLQPWRPDRVREVANLVSTLERVPVFGHLRPELGPEQLDADELPVDAFATDPFQRLLADVILWLFLDQTLEPHHVERGVAQSHVRAVVEDARFDPARLARRDRPDPELLTRIHDRVPEIVSTGSVQEVDLEPGDRGPPGPRDHDRDPMRVEVVAPVVLEVVDRRADELLQRLRRERPLHLDGMHVREGDLHVQVRLRRHTQRVETGVRVRELHPPDVRLRVQQHRVVDDPAVGRRHQHVFALLHGARGEIATRDPIDQPVGIRTAHLDRPFDADVPERDAFVQQPVLDLRIVVVPGEVHMVVDVVRGASGPERRLEERRLPVPRTEVKRRALREHLITFVDHRKASLRAPDRAGRPGHLLEASFRRRPGCKSVPARVQR